MTQRCDNAALSTSPHNNLASITHSIYTCSIYICKSSCDGNTHKAESIDGGHSTASAEYSASSSYRESDSDRRTQVQPFSMEALRTELNELQLNDTQRVATHW